MALAACMGDAPEVLGVDQYAQRASAICLAAQAAPRPDRSNAADRAELDRIDGRLKQSEQRWLQELRALSPPPELSQRASEWLEAVDDTVIEWDRILDASAGRTSWTDVSQARLERANARADRLAEALGVLGCSRASIGEGFEPYSLSSVRRTFAGHGVHFTAPTNSGTAYGYACPPPDGWRLLVGHAWTALLFSNSQLADRFAACLTNGTHRHLQKGNLVVVGAAGSIPRSVRAAVSALR
jgi:hypothetical protein